MTAKLPLIALCLFAVPAVADLPIEIVPGPGVSPGNVWVLLDGSGSSDGQLSDGVPAKLSDITNGQFTIAPGSGLGRIYFSFNDAIAANAPFTSATKTRFDWVELTYVPPGVSQANLTAVDQFGIPLKIEAFDAQGKSLGSKQWAYSGNTIIRTLSKLAPKAVVKTTGGGFARVQAPNQLPSAYPGWSAYLATLKGQKITITDSFVGVSPPIVANYSGTFADKFGTITLSGTLTQNGAPYNGGTSNFSVTVYGVRGQIPQPAPDGIPALTTAQQVYPSNGPYFRSDSPSTYHTAGENNVYSVIYRDLMSGLNNGFIGGKFGNSFAGWANKPAFSGARRAPDDGFYNQFAAAIEPLSGNTIYGYAFSDATTHPLLTITDAAKLQISIFADATGKNVKPPTLGAQSSVKVAKASGGRVWRVTGIAKSDAGYRSLKLVTIAGRQSKTYALRRSGNRWTALIKPGKSKVLRARVTVVSKIGEEAARVYRLRG